MQKIDPKFLFNSSYFCPGLRDHKGERISVNLFGNIAETVKENEASVIVYKESISPLSFITIWILIGLRLQTSEKRDTQGSQWQIPMVKVWKRYRSQASWWEDFWDVWKVNIGECMIYRDYRKNVFPLDNQDVWLICTLNVYSFSVNDNDGEIEGVVLGYQPPYFYMACGNCSKAIPEKQLTCGECGTSTKSATPQPEFHTTLVVETQQEEIKEVQIFTSTGQFTFAKRILIKSFYNRGKLFYI